MKLSLYNNRLYAILDTMASTWHRLGSWIMEICMLNAEQRVFRYILKKYTAFRKFELVQRIKNISKYYTKIKRLSVLH